MNNWILPENQREIKNSIQERFQHQKSWENPCYFSDDLSPNYVLIDAALWDTDINVLLSDKTAIYRSLFRGSAGEKLWSVAPYLVDIASIEKFVDIIKKKDSIKRRVTWLSSSLCIDELRKHLRHFLRMQREGRRGYIYFRFYDPFVIKTVFPNLSKEQYSEFFEKIDYLIADDIRVNTRHIFYLSHESTLQIKHQPLDYVDNK